MKVVDHGSTPPPREYTVVLERSRRAPAPHLQALSLAGASPRVHDEVAEEQKFGVRQERDFELVSYSGTDEQGTGFYQEV